MASAHSRTLMYAIADFRCCQPWRERAHRLLCMHLEMFAAASHGIFAAASHGVSALTDSSQATAARRSDVAHVGEGFSEGGRAFAQNMLRGATGVFTKPMEGAGKGIGGFLGGMAKVGCRCKYVWGCQFVGVCERVGVGVGWGRAISCNPFNSALRQAAMAAPLLQGLVGAAASPIGGALAAASKVQWDAPDKRCEIGLRLPVNAVNLLRARCPLILQAS
eukprot:1158533-Pelagomonas_calceolata.AAC.6